MSYYRGKGEFETDSGPPVRFSDFLDVEGRGLSLTSIPPGTACSVSLIISLNPNDGPWNSPVPRVDTRV